MLKAPFPQQFQFEIITLDELVPEDHLVRRIDAAIDPVRLIKMCCSATSSVSLPSAVW